MTRDELEAEALIAHLRLENELLRLQLIEAGKRLAEMTDLAARANGEVARLRSQAHDTME